jgi:NAD+ kinase
MKKPIRTIGLVANMSKKAVQRNLGTVVRWLKKKVRTVLLEPAAAEAAGCSGLSADPRRMSDESDLVVVLGGDGTFLYAAGVFYGSRAPVLGINFGTVGFLNEAGSADYRTVLSQVLKGDFSIEKRMMLRADTSEGRGPWFCLNDITLSRSALSRALDLRCFVSGVLTSSYKADGIIIATPTGSTAYSLSSHGPVVAPDLECIVINPICPHTLAVRPLVVRPTEEVRMEAEPLAEPVYLTVDGQTGISLSPGEAVIVRRAPHPARMVVTGGRNFFDLLSRKMNWIR